MATSLNARTFTTNGFPPDEGTRLADGLLKAQHVDWDDLTLDVQSLPSSLLISAFFNGFLQRVYEAKPNLLQKARRVKWTLVFPFQHDNVTRWMKDFQPVDATSAQSR